MKNDFFSRKRIYTVIWTVISGVSLIAIKTIFSIQFGTLMNYISTGLFIVALATVLILFIVWEIKDKFKELHDKIDAVDKQKLDKTDLMNIMDSKDTEVKNYTHRLMDKSINELKQRIDNNERLAFDKNKQVYEYINETKEIMLKNSFTEQDRIEFQMIGLVLQYRGELFLSMNHGNTVWQGNANTVFDADVEIHKEKEYVKKGLINNYGDKKTVSEIERIIDSVYIDTDKA